MSTERGGRHGREDLGFATRAIKAASRGPRLEQRPTAVPIYQSATFSTEDAAELVDILADEKPGFAYSRTDNPTVVGVGDAFAELHGAEAGYALATGTAAIHATLVSLLAAGERVVAARLMYGSTRVLLTHLLDRFGVRSELVDITDLDAVEAALAAAPARILYAETIANPTTTVADLAALADLAHRHSALFVVDNTFASPYLCRPLEHGADLVVESATKWIGGHSDVMAGIVAGSRDLVAEVRRVQIDTGGSLSPFPAFLVMRGMLTLAVRLERSTATATALGEWLERQGRVQRVFYPGRPSHPQADLAARQLRTGGGMLSFELTGGRVSAEAFLDALTLPERTASLGSVHTIVIHPATTSHRQLDDAALAEAGIDPGLLRCSIGLEDAHDLIADFEQALGALPDVEPAAAGTQPAPTEAIPA
jgi:cystathionine gamma-synthase/O-acetylhomoserine (thiol)-lyase